MTESLESLHQTLDEARAEVAKVIIGQEAVVDAALVAIFTRNHALIEGVPGVAKTLLVRTLAKVLGCAFNRIQFTPDLMPADILGTNIFNRRDNAFSLVKGPVFTTFLLADEINRAPAKTQSALLQAMQERQVTLDRETHPLSPGFTVFATQNPIEFEGTYPLPEAQIDRFLLKIGMPCPGREQELDLARRTLGSEAPEQVLAGDAVRPVLDEGRLETLRPVLNEIVVREELLGYVVDLVRRTRDHSAVLAGAGPRATQAFVLAGRMHAALDRRDFLTPDDIKALAQPLLAHRMTLRPEYEVEGVTAEEIITQILGEVPVPR